MKWVPRKIRGGLMRKAPSVAADMNLEEVETDVGQLLVHSGDEVITPIMRAHGSWEEKVGAKLRSFLRPGMTAVDVGANVGYFALLMAEQVGVSGRVIAFEPDPRNAHVLRLNSGRTRGAQIEVIEAAAWSERGVLDLALHATNTGDHRIGLNTAGRETVQVKAVRIDDVLHGRVDLILMDTQASEHIALRGARHVVGHSCPMLLVEFWPQGLREAGVDPVTVLDQYWAMGLRAYGAEKKLPDEPSELVLAVDSDEQPFTTLWLEPV